MARSIDNGGDAASIAVLNEVGVDGGEGKGVAQPFRAQRVVRPREQVEVQIKKAIFSGDLEEGSKLPTEAALADQFSVSRATVREALRGLASQGLITKTPGATGGSFVHSVGHEALSETVREALDNILRLGAVEIREATTLRRVLEVPSARLAAENRSEEDIVGLREAFETHRDAQWNDPAIPQHDLVFHHKIAEASGNRLLTAFVSALHRAIQPLFVDLTREMSQTIVRQHEAILIAIEAGDGAAAEVAIEVHLDYLTGHSRDLAAP